MSRGLRLPIQICLRLRDPSVEKCGRKSKESFSASSGASRRVPRVSHHLRPAFVTTAHGIRAGGLSPAHARPSLTPETGARSVNHTTSLSLSLRAQLSCNARTLDNRGRLRGAVHDFTLRRPTAIHNVSRNQSHGEEKNTDIQDHGREEPAGDVYEAQVWPDEEGL